MRGLPQKQNARRADKIKLCGHLRRYKKIVKKTYIIYLLTKTLLYFKTYLKTAAKPINTGLTAVFYLRNCQRREYIIKLNLCS